MSSLTEFQRVAGSNLSILPTLIYAQSMIIFIVKRKTKDKNHGLGESRMIEGSLQQFEIVQEIRT